MGISENEKYFFDYVLNSLKYGNAELHNVLFNSVKNKITGEVMIKL